MSLCTVVILGLQPDDDEITSGLFAGLVSHPGVKGDVNSHP